MGPLPSHLVSPVEPDTLVDNPLPEGAQKIFRCWDLRKDAVTKISASWKVKSTFKRTKRKKALKTAKGGNRGERVQWSFAKNIPKGSVNAVQLVIPDF